MGAFEDGQSFVAGFLAKLPEGLRASVEETLKKPEAKDAVTLIGDGVLARSDYSKRMDELKAKTDEATALLEKNQSWYAKNEVALKEYPTVKAELDRLKAGGGGTGDGDLDEAGVRKVALDAINEVGPEYIQVAAWLEDKGQEHKDLFGERLNTRELIANPKLGKPIAGQPGRVFSLDDAYAEKYGARVATKLQEAHDKGIETEVQKRLGEERAKLVGQPFPLRGEIGASVLDVLTTKEGPAAHTLDTAVDAYERLQAARGV